MNCVFWSIGVVSLQGMGHLLRRPSVLLHCHLCPRTELLPMCLDRTRMKPNFRFDADPSRRRFAPPFRAGQAGRSAS
jgi:hypothetical protein